MKKALKKVNHAVGKAIFDHGMIQDNEKILLGISGGKDSLALLHILFFLQRKAPVNFTILPVYIDLGFDNTFALELKEYVETFFGTILMEYTDYGVYAHSPDNRENPCFLCARLRRKRLFELAKEHHCGKIALGHNKDDLIETFFLNLLYAGKLGSMNMNQSFFKGEFAIIRPLAYLEKKEILNFCEEYNVPEFTNSCPSDKASKRENVRVLLHNLYKENDNIKGNIFTAMGQMIND